MQALLGTLLVAMLTVTILNVFSRNLFHLSIAFTEELASGLFVWLAFLGIGAAIPERLHVGVEILPRRAGPALRRALELLSGLAFVVFLVVLGVWGGQLVQRERAFNQVTESLGWPTWLFGISMPLGAGIGLVYVVKHAVDVLRGREP